MANLKNTIETAVKLKIADAKKKSAELFKGINKDSKKSSKEVEKVGKSMDKVGNKATVAGGKIKKGVGGIGGIFTTMKAGILSTIPALNSFKLALLSTGVGAIVLALGGFIALMVSAARRGAEFSKSLSGLKAVAGATSGEITTLSNQAKQLGGTTAFTASQVVELQTELSKLGFSVAEVGESTPAILDLAASLDVNLADAALLAGNTVRSFGLETEDTQRVVDVLASSAANSALNFSSLTESLKLAAPTMRAVGVDIEQTTAYLGALANNGLKGSIAGTGLAKTFIQLNKKGIDINDAFKMVTESANPLNEAVGLVGIIGAKTLLTLATGMEQMSELDKVLRDSVDGIGITAKSMAEIRLDNLAGDTTKLSSAWEGMLLSIEDGTGIMNTMSRETIQGLTSAIQTLPVVMDYLGFIWTDTWDIMKGYTEGAAVWLSGSFITMASTIKVFAAEAQLSLSKIPIIGEGLDTDRITMDLENANAALSIGLQKMQKAKDIFNEQGKLGITQLTRFSLEQAEKLTKQQAISNAKAQDAENEESEKKKEKKEKLSQEELDRQEKEREKEEAAIDKFTEKLRKKEEDAKATTDEAKLQLKRERHLAELEQLALDTEEKRVLAQQINSFYDARDAELRKEKQDEEDELEAIRLLEKGENQIAIDELDLEARRLRGENVLALEYELLEKKREQELSAAGLTAEQILFINKKYAAANKAVSDAEKESKLATLDAVGEGLQAASALAGENTSAGKALAVASAGIDTYLAAQKAYTSQLVVGDVTSPVRATIAAATAVAGGLANIKKIVAVKVPASKGARSGGGGAPSGGSPFSAPPTSISNLGNNNAARVGIDPSLGNTAGAAAANNVLGGSTSNVVFSESRYNDFRGQVSFKESKSTIGGG